MIVICFRLKMHLINCYNNSLSAKSSDACIQYTNTEIMPHLKIFFKITDILLKQIRRYNLCQDKKRAPISECSRNKLLTKTRNDFRLDSNQHVLNRQFFSRESSVPFLHISYLLYVLSGFCIFFLNFH